ncbi:MAG: alpha/beta fold hydrolase [Planctomycetaceae bacterium]|nr:alpha/beta fold hydrolase [Planctomycetaceae bacterium]
MNDHSPATSENINADFLKRNGIEQLYPFASHYLEIEGVKYHYVDEYNGEGDPNSQEVLLFVHGNPTWSFAWRNLIKPLSKKYRCIAVDHIGCGLSDKPQHYPYQLDQHIANLQQLVETLDLKEINLIAHDWGGAIGTGVAGRMPERFKRIVLMNTGAFCSKQIPFRISLCRIPLLGTLGIRGLNLFARAAISMAVDKSKPMPKDVARGYLAPYDSWKNRIATDRFVKDIPLSIHHESYATLTEVENNLSRLEHLPVLFPWGKRDWCFTTQFLDIFLKHFPNAQTKIFDQAGHYLFEEEPEELLKLISEFLEKLEQV